MFDKEQSREIRRQIRRILMDQWDPIGVNDIPEAADEYDSYIGNICELIQGDASEPEIAAHLRNIEIQQMELVDASGEPLFNEAKRNIVAASLRNLNSKYPSHG